MIDHIPNLKLKVRLRQPLGLFWLKLCVERAWWRYLLRLGQGLRASLLGSRENRGLILSMSLRGEELGGGWVCEQNRMGQHVCASDSAFNIWHSVIVSILKKDAHMILGVQKCSRCCFALQSDASDPLTSSFYMACMVLWALCMRAQTNILRTLFFWSTGGCYRAAHPSFAVHSWRLCVQKHAQSCVYGEGALRWWTPHGRSCIYTYYIDGISKKKRHNRENISKLNIFLQGYQECISFCSSLPHRMWSAVFQ